MIDVNQEKKIRNMLTIISLYFQLSEKCFNDESNSYILAKQKKSCKEAVEELINIMGVDTSFNVIESNKPTEMNIEVYIYSLKKISNIILDKLGYKKEGRQDFIKSCIDKI